MSSGALRLQPADAAQRAEALDPARSYIVQAPAGSGKTELLTQRFLRLLSGVEAPESVLAITFTRKAAAEMRSRVSLALQQAAAGAAPEEAHQRLTQELACDVLEQDRRRGWNLCGHPSRLRIQTIDSLCSLIARQMPWLSRLGAMPEPVDEAGHLYAQAARQSLRVLAGEEPYAGAAARLLWHLDNRVDHAEGLIAAMLARRDQWLRLIGSGGASRSDRDAMRRVLEEHLSNAIRRALQSARNAVPAGMDRELVELARYAASNRDAGSPLAACAGLDSLPGVDPQDLAAWLGLVALLLTKNEDAWRKRVDKRDGFPPGERFWKTRMEQALGRLKDQTEFLAALAELRILPQPAYSEEQWEVMESLLVLLPLAAAQLRLVFAARNEVDFCEIAQAAARALGDPEHPTDLALALGERIEHLLVDEFQDTSVAQVELIERLTAGWTEGDGRTLFLVGDPMQSIYRFREAEVGLFLQVRAGGIGGLRPRSLRLNTNFRSAAGLVQWVNEVFPKIFPTREDSASGAVAFAASEPCRPAGDGPAVRLHPLIDGSSAAEAEQLADIVEAARRQEPGGSIAILVRARTHLPAIIDCLKRRGLVFRAVEIDSLGRRPAVEDVWSLTRALLQLGDRTAWLALLRAPWCGLSLDALHALAAGDDRATIWELIATRSPELDEDSRARLEKVRSVLQDALDRRQQTGLRRMVESCWIRLGGPACLASESERHDVMRFLDLLEQKECGGDLDDPDAFQQDVERLYAEADSGAGGQLQIMTIHKAKGLEFDTVIVPGLHRLPQREEKALLEWSEVAGEQGPELLASPLTSEHQPGYSIWAYIRKLEKRKAQYELQRLLYVAATRAKKRLYLLGTASSDASQELKKPARGTLLHLLWPMVSGEFEAARNRPAAAGGQPESSAAAEAEQRRPARLSRLPACWRMGEPPPALVWQPQPFNEVDAAVTVTFDWAGETLRRVGSVVHEFLERIVREGVEHWPAGRENTAKERIRAALMAHGLAGEDLERAAAMVAQALHGILSDPRGRWILTRHQDDAWELALTGEIGGKVSRVVIDRTFVDANGTRWIIDYKTSAHSGGGKELFLDNEKRRYQPQLERYAQLMARMDSRPIRLGLYFPLLGGWREWPAGETPRETIRGTGGEGKAGANPALEASGGA